MHLLIGSDHVGLNLKSALSEYLEKKKYFLKILEHFLMPDVITMK